MCGADQEMPGVSHKNAPSPGTTHRSQAVDFPLTPMTMFALRLAPRHDLRQISQPCNRHTAITPRRPVPEGVGSAGPSLPRAAPRIVAPTALRSSCFQADDDLPLRCRNVPPAPALGPTCQEGESIRPTASPIRCWESLIQEQLSQEHKPQSWPY